MTAALTRATSAAAALLVAMPAVAKAAEDAGAHSVFAGGAGNRALALGGAYVAVVEDASAPIWNPGGLAFVERREVQVTHTNLFGLGFYEQYASVVLPSWRWGVASLTARTFGVDGVETRDDRNVLTGENLTTTELEVALGFGRRVAEHWGLGGTVKLQRQRVGESSDSGMGLDLGIRAHPLAALGSSSLLADRLTAGLSVRNVIQPTLQLDSDDVSDPSVLRAGIGYEQRLGERGSLTWALDLEKPDGRSARVHTGAEIALLPSLAFRGGIDGSSIDIGLGARWRDIALDYVFEDHPLGSVHRFGLTYAFGRTNQEARRAYRTSEEEKLQKKLADAFQERTRGQVDTLMDDATLALEEGRIRHALESIGVLKVLEPEARGLGSLEARALLADGIALEATGDMTAAVVSLGRAAALEPGDDEIGVALKRVRDALANRSAHSSEVRDLMRTSLEALAGDDLAGAREGFRAVLELAPGDADTRAMLDRTEVAISRRVENLLDRARTMAKAGLHDEATGALEAASKLAPGHTEIDAIAAAMAELAQKQAEPEPTAARVDDAAPPPAAKRPADTAPRRLSAREHRQVQNLYRLGMEAASERRIDDAIRYWEFVWSSDPTHADVVGNLKREYLARGLEAFASGELETAVAQWNQVLRIDPADERAKGYLARAREQESRFREIVGETQIAESDD